MWPKGAKNLVICIQLGQVNSIYRLVITMQKVSAFVLSACKHLAWGRAASNTHRLCNALLQSILLWGKAHPPSWVRAKLFVQIPLRVQLERIPFAGIFAIPAGEYNSVLDSHKTIRNVLFTRTSLSSSCFPDLVDFIPQFDWLDW